MSSDDNAQRVNCEAVSEKALSSIVSKHLDKLDPRLAVEYAASDDALNAPIPLFERVRNVKVADDGTLNCDCCEFDVFARPCEHDESVCHLVNEANGSHFEGK